MAQKKHRYRYGKFGFPTIEDVKKHAQATLQRIGLGNEIVGDDFVFFTALLIRHPHYEEKTGCGIVKLFVWRDKSHGPMRNPDFAPGLLRLDGSSDHFSYRKCASQDPEAFYENENFRDAFRSAVDKEVEGTRKTAFSNGQIVCPECKDKVLRLGDGINEVDHKTPWPFVRLTSAFLKIEGLKKGDIEIVDVSRDESRKRIKDDDLLKKWRSFHNERALLRVVCGPCNWNLMVKNRNIKYDD